ncbi:MAG: ABC transporter permease [Actinomycetota bacterium]|nr:ABC transporter permease [Actinomycetota bacterium]
MSTETEQSPAAAPTSAPVDRERGAWSLSWHGVATVAKLELRQRLRSTKWYIGLALFFGIVGIVTILTTVTVGNESILGDGGFGRVVFDVTVFFILLLGVLVAPTLSSSAINGDRKEGTLAILQVTLLTPAEIAVGKLLAAWTAALAFLVVSLPFLIWGVAQGGLSVTAVLATIGLLAFVLAVVVMIGLGFSSLVPKTSSSAVLTYLSVASLTLISLIVFGLSLTLVTSDEEVRVWTVSSAYEQWDGTGAEPSTQCEWRTQTEQVIHTERTWWLLAINPFVVVADAMPEEARADGQEYYGPTGIMSAIRYGVREARMGPGLERDYCWAANLASASPVAPRDADTTPVWPWGVGALTLLGGLGLATAVRRLSIPVRKLPRGTRVA